MPGSNLDPVLCSDIRRGQKLKAKAEADTERSRPRPRPKFWSWGHNNSGSVIRETAQESGGSSPTTSAFYATVIRPVLEYCAPVWHYAITRSQAEQPESIKTRAIHIIYPFTRACHILIYCSSLNLPPLNPGVTNFQGHSFKTSVTNPLPSSIYFPFHVIHLSRLGSKNPLGSHVLSHAPKKYCPFINYALNHYQVPPCNN